jgi:glycosyltransferase involved in cell wall biosynthesis
MAAGLPLIVTEETGLTDVCTDGVEGWVVPAKNVDQLAARLKWCRENSEEVCLAGENAYLKMRGRCMESYGARCAEIAKAIIDGRNPMSVGGVQE